MIQEKLLNPITGHTDPHCFKIVKKEDGLTGIWVKEHSTTSEEFLGQDGSRKHPFQLLASPVPDLENYHNIVPDAVPKTLSTEELTQLQRGLEACHTRMQILDPSDTNYNACLDTMSTLEEANAIPFHWVENGRFRKEEANPADMDDDEEMSEEPELGRRSILSSKKRRHGTIDDDQEVEVKEERHAVVGDMVVIKSDGENGQRFWLGRVQQILETEGEFAIQYQIQWYSARKEFGKYSPLVSRKRGGGKYLDDIHYQSILYSFDNLDDEGRIPNAHANLIAQIADD